MIALVAPSDDSFAQRLRDQLEQEGHAVCAFDWADILPGQGLSWWVPPQKDDSISFILTNQKVVRFSEITALVYLSSGTVVLPPSQEWEPADRDYINKEVSATILGILHSLNCPVINLPPAGGWPKLFFCSAHSQKLFQQHQVHLPPMTVVTDLRLAKSWVDQRSGPFRVASLDKVHAPGQGLIEREQHSWDVSRVPFPVFLQQVPAGQMYHLIIVGPSVLGGKVSQENFDGSFDTKVEPGDLPPDLLRVCVDLSRSFGLAFSECLMVESPEGSWYCLDWNSLPNTSHWDSSMAEPVISKFTEILMKLSVTT